MKRNVKSIAAAVIAATMCTTITGCKGKDVSESIPNASTSSSVSTKGSRPESGSVSNLESNNSESTSESSEPWEITLALTDEIKNADFDSGFVQMYNDVLKYLGDDDYPQIVEKGIYELVCRRKLGNAYSMRYRSSCDSLQQL